MKKIYQKSFDDDTKDMVYMWHEHHICPKCRRAFATRNEPEEWVNATAFVTEKQGDFLFGDELFDDLKKEDGLIGTMQVKRLPSYTCQKCEYTFAAKKWFEREYACSDFDIYNESYGETIRAKSESIYYDREQQKFIVFVSFVTKIPTQNGLIGKTSFKKWIVDLKKHTTIYWDPKNKQIVNATNHLGYNNTHFFDGLSDATPTLWVKLLKYMCYVKGVGSIYGELMKELTIIGNGQARDVAKNAFYLVNCLNRIPNTIVRYDDYQKTYKCIFEPSDFWDHYCTNDFIKKSPHEIMDHQEYLKMMIKQYKLPKSKSFWKMYLEQPAVLSEVMYFKSCGFKNTDSLRTMVASKVINMFVPGYAGNKSNEDVLKTLSAILKKMLKASSESQVARKFSEISEPMRYRINDMVYMYNKLKKEKKEYLKLVDWSGSFREIHDELSKLITKIKYENRDIPYDQGDYQLREIIGEYTFDLAKDTNQLVEIGQRMGICVGSYREFVLDKRSKIVHVRSNDKYVGCIELSSTHTLIQAKAKYNNMMTGELAQALKRWVVKKKIKDVDKCWDYKNLNRETQKTFDYHSLELDDDGNVVPASRNRNNTGNVLLGP